MIPLEWIRVIRPDDREVVGYLEMSGDGFLPYDLLGRPVQSGQGQNELAGEPQALPYDEAEEVLIDRGLGYLAARWKLQVDDVEQPIDVVIRELTPATVSVMIDDYQYSKPLGTVITLDLPEISGRLRQGSSGGPRFLNAVPH